MKLKDTNRKISSADEKNTKIVGEHFSKVLSMESNVEINTR